MRTAGGGAAHSERLGCLSHRRFDLRWHPVGERLFRHTVVGEGQEPATTSGSVASKS